MWRQWYVDACESGFYKADEAVAHRQCARNADALKPGDGNCSDSIL